LETSALLMRIGAVSVIFFSISGISTGILQGINKMYAPVRNSAFGIGFKIIAFIVMIYVFDTGLVGAVIINVIFSMIVAVANFYSIQKTIKLQLDYKSSVVLPLIAGAVMSVVALAVHTMMMAATSGNTIATMLSIVVAGLTYFVVLLKFGGVSEKDIKVLPMGNKIMKMVKKLRLM